MVKRVMLGVGGVLFMGGVVIEEYVLVVEWVV